MKIVDTLFFAFLSFFFFCFIHRDETKCNTDGNVLGVGTDALASLPPVSIKTESKVVRFGIIEREGDRCKA